MNVVRHSQSSSHRRGGITIFEVVLALAIFTVSLGAISELAQTGTRASIQARMRTKAMLRAESKLGEILAGHIPMEDASQPFEDDADWEWTLVIHEGPVTSLLGLELTVTNTNVGAMGKVSHTITRMARDREALLEMALEAAEAEAAAAEEEQ